ncbi:MAG TPA: PilZ domain-containing protein [Sphingomicrobium sp.]|nr:PilZ domain-containing protein [Sphingomicrobium sp.]
MGFESAPPNDFRASLQPGASRASPVVTEKRARKGATGGLGEVKVSRTETRRANQRDGDRHRLTDEQAIVRRKGKNHVVELINVSQGGAMVAGTFKAKLWEKVSLVLAEAGEIECAVRWIREDRIGLEFAHETRIECDPQTLDNLLRQVIRNSFPEVEIKDRPPEAEKAAEKRLLVRHPLIWSGILHHDYEWEVVRLRNVSSGGALIECSANLPTGVTVYLDLGEAGRLAATVSWSRGNQSGLAFSKPFDVSDLAKSTPEVAAKGARKSQFAPYGRDCDQSPWAPQWDRLSVKQLGDKLGG